MSLGTKYTVVFHEEVGSGNPIIDSIDFTGKFSYTGDYVSNVVVKKEDQATAEYSRFIVTYFWAEGEGPNLSTVTVAALLADAFAQVSAAMPDEI
jgi:hypothetical protein